MGAYEYQYTPSPPPEIPPVTPRLERLGGKDRFETAVEISKAGWNQSDIVILARNDVYADALAGVPLAYLHNAPLLLTQTDSLPIVTKAEIIRLGAKKVIILGGIDAVSRKVQQKLSEMSLTVQRIGASNRFGTAAAIADLVAPNGKEQVALANGYDFPDALSAAAYAANKGMPILLTDRDTLPQETSAAITKLNVEQTIVVGGKEAISEAALAGIGEYLRIAGKDRYGTAIALANHFVPSADRVFIATGLEFADSLTGAALAAKEGCGILLVNQPFPDPVTAYLAGKNVTLFTVFGGRAAVSEEIADQLIQ
jgi:lactocepin